MRLGRTDREELLPTPIRKTMSDRKFAQFRSISFSDSINDRSGLRVRSVHLFQGRRLHSLAFAVLDGTACSQPFLVELVVLTTEPEREFLPMGDTDMLETRAAYTTQVILTSSTLVP